MAVPCPLLSHAALGTGRDGGGPGSPAGLKVEKPGHVLKAGDVLTLGKGPHVITIRVLTLAKKRGSAKEAWALYEVID
jgi:hypothetical protein